MAGSLFDDRYTDPAGILTAAESEALVRALHTLAARGHSAWVVVVPPDDALGTWRRSWGALDLDEEQDLLLLYGPTGWEARGWRLERADIGAIVARHAPRADRPALDGITEALDALAAAAPPPPPAPPSWGPPLGLASMIAFSGLGWVLVRRARRASVVESTGGRPSGTVRSGVRG